MIKERDEPKPDEEVQEPEEQIPFPEDPSTGHENHKEGSEEAEPPEVEDVQLEALAVQFLQFDRQGLEAEFEQGRILKRARDRKKKKKAWIAWLEERLGLDYMAAYRLIGRADAADKFGFHESLNLGRSVIDILMALKNYEKAMKEAIRRSKVGERITCKVAHEIADRWKGKKGSANKSRPDTVELANSPEAIGRHLARNFTDEEIEVAFEWAAEAKPEPEDLRANRPRMGPAIKWVTPARAKKLSSDLGPGLGAYLIKGDWLHATDGNIFAATPFQFEGCFAVPAPPFEKAIKDEPELELGEGEVVLHHKDGSTTRIPVLDPDEFPEVREPSGAGHTLTPKACRAVRELTEFCSRDTSRPEAMGIKIVAGTAVVANGKTKVWVKGTGLDADIFIPIALLDFIYAKRVEPVELVVSHGWVWCIWPDGSYAGMALAELNADAQGVFSRAQADLKKLPKPTIEHPDDWRAAVRKVKRSGAEEVLIYHDCLRASFKSGSNAVGDKKCEVEVPVETPLPVDLEGECLVVPVRLIEPVLKVADAIDFTAYPDAVPFAGEYVVGLVELPKTAGE